MKTIKLIIVLFLATFGVFSQNITNTLGTSGLFTIKDASVNYLTLNQSTGQVNILKTLRLENTTSSTAGVIFKGVDRFLHNYGTENTFLGVNSGNFTMTGNSNTAVGLNSLFINSTGSYNSALGYFALLSNTFGIHNTALGSESSSNNSSGNSNTAVGSNSLQLNSTGSRNVAIGFMSLFNNRGGDNTALGTQSLYSNVDGIQNTSVGFSSLYSNTINSGNTAVGYNSLFSSTGWNNTAVGHHSLNNNTTGNYNTAIGYNSGSTISTGANLTCIGIDANPTSGSAVDQITLGNGFVSSLRCNVTTITSLSDMRDKKNIKDLSLGLDFITKLKPRQFNWDKREWYGENISDGSKMDITYTAGFIAQEFDEVQSSENAEWMKLVLKDNPEKWEATPGNLLPIMVKAIQELKEENDRLKTEIETLMTDNKKATELEVMFHQLKEKIEQLETETQNVRISNK